MAKNTNLQERLDKVAENTAKNMEKAKEARKGTTVAELNAQAEVVKTQQLAMALTCETNIDNLQRQTEGIAAAIAGNLAVIKENKLYEVQGYKNFGEYCEKRFEISKATGSEAATTFKRFGIINEDGTFRIHEDFATYNFSTLISMKKLTNDEIKALGINPAMTRAQVKDIIANKDKIAIEKKNEVKERKRVDDLATALSAFVEKEEVADIIKKEVPTYFDKTVTQDSTVLGNLADVLELEIDRRQNPVDESAVRFPQRKIALSQYKAMDGTIMKERLLKDIWKLIQRVNESEFDLVIMSPTTQADES